MIERFIDIHDNRMDNIFDSLNLPDLKENFQFLSIDIDGDDYGVWRTLLEYRPKLILIEADSFAPPNIVKISLETGTSAAALVMLGKQKGYELITHCGNVFFIVKELFDQLGIANNSLENVFDYGWINGRF